MLDWPLVFGELEPLSALREMPEPLLKLEQLKQRVESGG